MMRLLLLVLCIGLLSPVAARQANQAVTISPKTYKALQKIEQLIAAKSYQQAQQQLTAMLATVKPKSYTQATILRSLYSVYALQGHYKKSADVLSQCLALAVLPAKQKRAAVLNLGQLYMATEQYARAIKTLEPYLADQPELNAPINAMIANAYAQLAHYNKALPYIEQAILAASSPKESWYQLNLAIYFELKNYTLAARLLNKLTHLYPDKKTYWNQLASVYQQLEQYNQAVSIKRIAYKEGFLDSEQALLNFANLLLYVGSPYQSARLIQREIEQKNIANNAKNWELLATTWTMAKEFERAIQALKTASELNQKGSLYQQLGQIYMEQEKWQPAIKYLQQALAKGGLKNAGLVHLLLGIAYYETKRTKQAKASFLNATNDAKHKKSAGQWLNYIRSVASM